jgi:hypothetical protein
MMQPLPAEPPAVSRRVATMVADPRLSWSIVGQGGLLHSHDSRVLFDEQFEDIATPSIKTFSRRPAKERASAWLTLLQDRNLDAEEIGWPFRLGLEGGIVDRSQDIGWQRTFGHGRKIVP